MSSHPLLEAAPGDQEAVRLRREIAGLEQELREAKAEAEKQKQASSDAIQAIRALRKATDPLYTALKMIHGEIARVDAATTISETSTRINGNLWIERIAKAPGPEARVLQVLLDGAGPMSLSQIRAAAGTSSNTSTYLSRLYAKNWVQKVGHGSWSLKEL